MGTNIKITLGTMKTRVGPDSLKLAIIFGATAFLLGIKITFLLIAILRFKYTDEDRQKEEAAETQGGPK